MPALHIADDGPPAGAAGALPPAPSEAAVNAFVAEYHRISLEGSMTSSHLAGQVRCALRAAYAVDGGAAREASGPEPRDKPIRVKMLQGEHAGEVVDIAADGSVTVVATGAPSGLPTVAMLAAWLQEYDTEAPHGDLMGDGLEQAAVSLDRLERLAAWLLARLAGAP
jgi:hypothetical protein